MERLKELLKKPYVWIGLVGIVLLVLFLRARRGAGAGGPIPQPQPQGGGGGGYGGGGGGGQSPQDTLQQQMGYQQAQLALETGRQQLDYEKRLQDLQLQGLGSQLEYQQAGQKLQEQYQQGTLGSAVNLANEANLAQSTAYGTQATINAGQSQAAANYYRQISNREVSCPGSASLRIDPTTGAPYCRQKTSGNILGIPVGSIFRTGQGIAQGAQEYAPQAGYQLAQAGTQFAVRNYLTSPVAPGGAGQPANTGQTGGQGPSYGVGPSTRAPQPYDPGLSAPSPMRQRMA